MSPSAVASEVRTFRVRVARASEPQRTFWASTAQYLAFVGGIGSGKTYAGTFWLLSQPVGTYIVAAPTYKILKSATTRTLLDIVEDAGLVRRYQRQDGELELVDGKRILFRSCERPENLRGPNANGFWLDEGALLRDDTAWKILIGRARLAPGLGRITTTPKGKNWVYERFVDPGRPGAELVRCSTRDSPFLREGFVEDLEADYADDFQAQEIDGEFVEVGAAELFAGDALVQYPTATEGLPAVRAWDVAATAGGGDYTVGVLLAGPGPDGFEVLDVVRGQWEPDERDRIMLATARTDGEDVRVWVPQERAAAGLSQVRYWVRQFAGFAIEYSQETGDKALRANPYAVQVNAGNVRLVVGAGRWTQYHDRGRHLPPTAAAACYARELGIFPMGRHDDQVDASSAAFRVLTASDSGISA